MYGGNSNNNNSGAMNIGACAASAGSSRTRYSNRSITPLRYGSSGFSGGSSQGAFNSMGGGFSALLNGGE